MFERAISFLCNTLPRLYRIPYEILYWRGPSLYGYGFWAGATSEDICMSGTGVPSKHWNQNGVLMCEEMKERYFTSFFIAIHTLMALMFVSYYLMRICCCRPIGDYIIRVIAAIRGPCIAPALCNQPHIKPNNTSSAGVGITSVELDDQTSNVTTTPDRTVISDEET